MEEKNSKETQSNKEKKNSIVHQVVRPMIFFLIGLLLIESAFLFLYYINYSVKQREESASRLAIYTASQFEKYNSIGWIADYWKENYDHMDLVYNYKINELREDAINQYFTQYTSAKDVATAEVEEATIGIQKLYAEVAYSRICDSLDSIKRCYEPMFLYSFVIEDGDILFLATGTLEDELRYSQGGEVFEIGTKTPYVEGVYPVLDEILATGEVPENLEMSLSPGADRSVVHMFAPVKDENGNVVMYIGVAVKWKDLISQAFRMMATLSLVTLIVFVLIGIYISSLLVKKVTKPVAVEKLALARYRVYKDPEKLKDNLSEVRSNNEIEELAIDFCEMADDLDRYMLENQKAAIDKERIKSELSMAKTIQESRLPNKFPPFPDRHDFDIYASMTPTKEVAGDFYDFFMVDNDHIALVIADVSGKGISASLFMMLSKAIIRCRLLGGESPAEALDKSNAQILQGNDSNMFVTMWVAILDLRTGKGLAANAGHEHPALRRKDGQYELIKYPHSPAVGVMEGIPYTEHEFTLNPGDSLFVYTDGVPEATNKNGELFGEEKLLVALNREPDASPDEIDKNVKKAIEMFVDGAEQFDDITMLGLKYNG